MLVISISESNLGQDQVHILSVMAFRGNLWLSNARYCVIFHKCDRNLIEVTLIFKSVWNIRGRSKTHRCREVLIFHNESTYLTHGSFWTLNSKLLDLKTLESTKITKILPDVPTGLRPTVHAAPYRANGPSPTPSSPINQSAHNLQPANSWKSTQLTPKNW
jgi:hypothetical protein